MPGLDPHWQAVVERSIQEFLVWVGFGTIVGLTAKAIMPGKDPGGAVATLLMGIVGSIIGCGTLAFFIPNTKITPISPFGFIAATAGAFLLLAFYKMLSNGRKQQVDIWLSGSSSPSGRRQGVREAVRL